MCRDLLNGFHHKSRRQCHSFSYNVKPIPRFAAAGTCSCHSAAMQYLGYEFIEFVPIILHSYVLMALCKTEFLNSILTQRFYIDSFF